MEIKIIFVAATVKFNYIITREYWDRENRTGCGGNDVKIQLKSEHKILWSAVFDEIQLHQQFTEYFHNEYRCSDCEDAVVIRKLVQRGYGDATRSLKAVILLHL